MSLSQMTMWKDTSRLFVFSRFRCPAISQVNSKLWMAVPHHTRRSPRARPHVQSQAPFRLRETQPFLCPLPWTWDFVPVCVCGGGGGVGERLGRAGSRGHPLPPALSRHRTVLCKALPRCHQAWPQMGTMVFGAKLVTWVFIFPSAYGSISCEVRKSSQKWTSAPSRTSLISLKPLSPLPLLLPLPPSPHLASRRRFLPHWRKQVFPLEMQPLQASCWAKAPSLTCTMNLSLFASTCPFKYNTNLLRIQISSFVTIV